ncbi:MAG: sulfur oxidation c-type cytochrome SoxX [Zoogloeaceae bacterium]|nr:sulfur oxidation c-type cytochrome SoxX [Zoogloeaceae bacterium]
MSTKPLALAASIALAIIAAACATATTVPSYRAEALTIIKRDFKPHGQAELARLDVDPVLALCNQTGNTPSAGIAHRMQDELLATVQYPADGVLMGDWQKGETLAQDSRGLTWSDDPAQPAGGGCYNCHQIGPSEIAYGTLGPSLYQIGKLRGNTPETQKYIYSKIYNAKAYNLCSAMPRFGHAGVLTPEQIKDLVALLLDPASPVNQ